jgi:hypothetical protein
MFDSLVFQMLFMNIYYICVLYMYCIKYIYNTIQLYIIQYNCIYIYICHNTISCLYMTEHLNSYYNVCVFCFVFCSVVYTFISLYLVIYCSTRYVKDYRMSPNWWVDHSIWAVKQNRPEALLVVQICYLQPRGAGFPKNHIQWFLRVHEHQMSKCLADVLQMFWAVYCTSPAHVL